MFEARLQQAKLFKFILEAIKDLVSECNFDCSDSGISLQAMDSSHVALVTMLISRDGFCHYRCDHNLSLGIDLTNMARILKRAKNDDMLTIKADDQSDVLTLIFESKDNDKLSRYDIQLMNIMSDHLGIPETTYDAAAIIPSLKFNEICRDMASLSEYVTIDVTKQNIKFSGACDTVKGSVTLKSDHSIDKDETTIIELRKGVSLTFSIKYLVYFTRASPLASRVSLNLSSNVPLLVNYMLDSLGYVRYYLAPKIDDER